MIYLNSTTVSGVRSTTTSHSGSLFVYSEALRSTALSVSQLPRAATSPELIDFVCQSSLARGVCSRDLRNGVRVKRARACGGNAYILIVVP